MNEKVKLWLKAVGFLLFIGAIYLYANVVMGAIAGIVLAFGALGGLVSPDMSEAPLEGFNEGFANAFTSVEQYLPMMSVGVTIITLGFVATAFMARKNKFLEYVSFKKISMKSASLLIVLGVALYLVIVPLLNYVLQILPTEMVDNYMELMEMMTGTGLIGTILMVSINAPLFEEILVRGVILNDFKKAAPLWLAVVIQALIFGVMHMNIIQGSYAFIIGLVFGMVYVYFESIWAPIALHFAFNTTSLSLGALLPETMSNFGYLLMLVIGIAISSIVFTVIRRIKVYI